MSENWQQYRHLELYMLLLKNKHSLVDKEVRAQMNAAESEKLSAKTGSQRQLTLYSVVSKTQPHDRNGRRWTELTDSIIYWIVKDSLPLYVVEKRGFKKMIDVFDLMKSKLARIGIPALYATTHERVSKEILCLFLSKKLTRLFLTNNL